MFVLLILLAGGGYFGYKQVSDSRAVLSRSIKSSLTFGIFWPTKDSPLIGDKTTIKYDTTENHFDYNAILSNGTLVTISEQATPESFVDIPQAYEKLVESMHTYRSFDSQTGKVYLTRPPQSSGNQTAVMNAKGTLLFMRAYKDLDDNTWTKIFNNLESLK